MGLRASLQSASRIVRLAGSTLYELLDVGHGAANIVLRASFALFCCGLLLQAISNQTDPYRCTALVQHGAWPPYSPPKVNPAAYYERLGTLERQHREPAPARPFEEWEPAGCRMHEYSQEDISVCLGGKRVLFVGDSAMRVLFLAALRRLDPKAAKVLLHTTFTKPNPRHDLTIESNTVQLQFLWDPWLNSTKLEEEMTRLELGRSGSGNSSADMADLIVIGSAGLWIARNAADSLYFDTFRASAERVVRIMDESILPFGKQKSNNYVFLAPVQIPRYEKLQESRARALAPDRIKRMNDYLGSFPSAVQSHILTAYKDMTYHVPEAYQDTGLHVLDAVAERWIDVPLNARCNGMLLKLPADERPVPSMSLSTTCCAAPLELVRGQVVMLYGICATVIVPILVLLFKNRSKALSSYISYTFIGLALLYCCIAEHSHTFAKSEKHFEANWIRFSFFATGICSVASQRRWLATGNGARTEFLSRHTTDEWKGLIQASILLLTYQDYSQISFVTRWTEFATASYLFLSAFGHATYFLRCEDYSPRRVALVLLRLNLLPSLVALMLDGYNIGTTYSVSRLVMFPRLISIWFLIVYITLRVGSQVNRNHPHLLLLKILVVAALLVNLVFLPGKYGFFETIGRYVFGLRSALDVEEIRRDVQTSWCAPFAGMVVAVLAQRVAAIGDRMDLQLQYKHQHFQMQESVRLERSQLKQSLNGDTGKSLNARVVAGTLSSNNNFSPFASPEEISIRNSVGKGACLLDRMMLAILHPGELMAPVQPIIIIFCGLFFGVFASATTVSEVLDGNQLHPCLTTAAIVCFAVVRNAHSQLRTTYMALPAALGAISLELSVLQNHILLSGNGTGHLRLFSIYQPAIEAGGGSLGQYLVATTITIVHCLEIVSVTAIFLAVGWYTHRSTQMLTARLFGGTTTEMEDAKLSVKVKARDAREVAGLPHYNDDELTHVLTHTPGLRTSSVLLRSSGVLFAFWSLSRYYL